MNDSIVNILKEAKRIEENCTYSGKAHYNVSGLWRSVHFILGIIVTGLVFWAGFEGIKDITKYHIYIIFFSGILSAIYTFIGASQKSATHKLCGDSYLSLKNNIRIFYTIELENIDITQAISSIKNYQNKLNKIHENAPGIPQCAYRKVKKGVQNGESEFEIDKEQDNDIK